MWSNTKLLILTSVFVIVTGLGFLFFGLSPKTISTIPSPKQTPYVVETTPVATSSGIVGVEGERVVVTRVVDGDTFDIENGKAVRMVGIDTPETVDPKRPVGCFGKEASNETKSLLTGKVVILQKDMSETDKYGRLLRYVFLPLEDGQILFVDDYLVREGFAKVLTYPPDVKYNQQFRQAEEEAKQAKRGLWGRC